MATGALSFAAKNFFAPRGRFFAETALRWCRGGNGELIKMQSRQFRSNHVGNAPGIAGAAFGGHRILGAIIEARVKKCTRAVHFSCSYIGIPIRNRSEAGPGMKIYSSQTESRWNQCAGLAAIWPHCLTVLVDLGVEAARSPTGQDFL